MVKNKTCENEKKSSNIGTIGERIKIIRGDDTQAEFAARLGITQRAVVNYETQGRVPKKAVLRKISEQFGVNPAWLLTGDGEMAVRPEAVISEPVPKKSEGEARQHIEIIDAGNKKSELVPMYDTSARDKELIQALRDNASLLRENGDLRVEAERQKARIAELTRQGAAGEREGHEAALARLELENRELRARVRHLEQALAAAPPRSDTLQNDIPPAPEQP